MSVETPFLTGIVCRSAGTWCMVKLDNGERIKARICGRLKLHNENSELLHPIAVGDEILLSKKENDDYIIDTINPRKNLLSRRIERIGKQQILATNMDQIIICSCLKNPYVPLLFLDTVIAAARIEHISPILLFNKKDIYEKEEITKLNHIQLIYEKIGYNIIATSVQETETLKRLLSTCLLGKRSLLIGYSGIGKSSLMNALIPHADLHTQEISEANHTGKHTTTFSTMYEMGGGGGLIDSPGIRSFSLNPNILRTDLRLYFDEFLLYQEKCNFISCTHTHEKHCAVRDGVKNGDIAKERYYSYQHLFNYLKDIEKNCY